LGGWCRMRHLGTWLRTYGSALLLCVNFAIGGIIYAAPMGYERSYMEQWFDRGLPVFFLLGPLMLPAENFYRAISLLPSGYPYYRDSAYIFSQSQSPLIAPMLLILSICVIGGLLCWLLSIAKLRRFVNFLLTVNFALGVGLSSASVLKYGFGGLAVIETYSLKYECTASVSDTTSIRILGFDSDTPLEAGLAGTPLLWEEAYLISYGESDEWREFIHIVMPIGRGSCDRIHSLSNNFIWLWQWKTLFISDDNGKTWRTWDTTQLAGEFADTDSDKADSHITDVVFENTMMGKMSLEYFEHSTQTHLSFTLYTTDSGATWTFNSLP
jgi:hypothetical protein